MVKFLVMVSNDYPKCNLSQFCIKDFCFLFIISNKRVRCVGQDFAPETAWKRIGHSDNPVRISFPGLPTRGYYSPGYQPGATDHASR